MGLFSWIGVSFSREEIQELKLLNGEDKTSKQLGRELYHIKNKLRNVHRQLSDFNENVHNFRSKLGLYLTNETVDEGNDIVAAIEKSESSIAETDSSLGVIKKKIERLVEVGEHVYNLILKEEAIDYWKKQEETRIRNIVNALKLKSIGLHPESPGRPESTGCIPAAQGNLNYALRELDSLKGELKRIKYVDIPNGKSKLKQAEIEQLHRKLYDSIAFIHNAAWDISIAMAIILKFKYNLKEFEASITHERMKYEANRMLIERIAEYER